MTRIYDCDIFCRIVDNFGDIGVCWRLARQLAAEHGLNVRLWVDDLATFQKLAPALNPAIQTQSLDAITVQTWRERTPDTSADIVIQTFGCDLPPAYLTAMALKQPHPVWINLEYLSAESWVEGCHRMPSPHPQLPLTCHFFFPGFTGQTGGLLREAGLIARLSEFRNSQDRQKIFWEKHGIRCPPSETLKVSLFCYPTDALAQMLDIWAQGDRPIFCALPGGNPLAREWASSHPRHGNLALAELPFLSQPDYDLLLAACDLNFVRGEDSFVRAQWAGQPLVWHIYRQAENAHLVKLEAFLERYLEDLGEEPASALREFWSAWENSRNPGPSWPRLLQHWPALRQHAEDWRNRLAGHEDLCSSLLTCCKDLLQ